MKVSLMTTLAASVACSVILSACGGGSHDDVTCDSTGFTDSYGNTYSTTSCNFNPRNAIVDNKPQRSDYQTTSTAPTDIPVPQPKCSGPCK